MAQLRERSDYLHEILTQHAQQLLLPRGLPPESRDRLFKATRWMRDQPERRAEYFKGMMGAWMMLQVAVIVTMGIPVAVAVAFDLGAVRAVASVAAGLEAFCSAGAFLAAWWYYAARWAAREARRRGPESAEYSRAVLRATSSGQTVKYQALLGIVVMIIVLAA
jgi:hypothetical protein